MADKDFDAFVEQQQKTISEQSSNEELVRRSLQAYNDAKLHGDALVKRNEFYIAKHREAEYQRQKLESEQKLKESLAPHAQPPLDETSRWGPNDWFEGNDPHHQNKFKFREPGLEYKPPSQEPPLVPRKGETLEEYKERQDKADLYGGRIYHAPSHGMRNIKAHGTHIISRCIIT
jgi:hypothetical protein